MTPPLDPLQDPQLAGLPALILVVFLGIFARFTAKFLIDFKFDHPNVHTTSYLAFTTSAGDAGYISL